MNSPVPEPRLVAALQNCLVADALAMPVHWFYNPLDIYRAFPGGIQKFEAAPQYHPSSIMNLHSTNGGGRGSQQAGKSVQVVGDIILKGKRQYWGVANQHYHRGLPAGENTLNAYCLRLVIRCLSANKGRYDPALFLRRYIEFMTADSPQHPDTYAESFHRGFFANLAKGVAPERCGAVTHDTASVGGLVMIAPIAFAGLLHERDLAQVQAVCRLHLQFTHPDKHLAQVCDAYVALIDGLLFGKGDARELIAAAARHSAGIDPAQLVQRYSDDNQVVGGKFSRACYIEDSWPSLLYLAWKYMDNPRQALLVNANLGGDNCHRGAVLGVILGLASGEGLGDWFSQLEQARAIEAELSDLMLALKSPD